MPLGDMPLVAGNGTSIHFDLGSSRFRKVILPDLDGSPAGEEFTS